MGRRRTAVLISGGGTNLQALLDDTRRADAAAEIVLVVSNVAGAYGLERARRAGVATRTILPRDHADRAAFEAAIDRALDEAAVTLVCLAGFMRLLSRDLVTRWRDRMLNIHPSLLPAVRGLGAQAQALAAGVRVAGCTVHLVRPEMDAGPIILQGIAPVLPGDSAETLAARILAVEHRCYPRALELVAAGRTRVVDERVVVDADPAELLVLHPLLMADRPRRGHG
jgi:phosphoribosylglycinamide formyltransferase-1